MTCRVQMMAACLMSGLQHHLLPVAQPVVAIPKAWLHHDQIMRVYQTGRMIFTGAVAALKESKNEGTG